MPEQRKLENGRLFAKVEKGGPYRVIRTGYKPIRLQESRSVSAATLKPVQSALSDLLTASATHGTFSRPSTKRGLILISLELNTSAREPFGHC